MSTTSVAAKFPGALSGLERRGGGILVVGTPDGQRRVCERLLGSTDRERLVVATDQAQLTANCHHGATEVRARPTQAAACRAGAVMQSSTLADQVVETIDDHAQGLDPSELRICLGSAASDATAARSIFFDAVLTELERVSALGHVHVPGTYDSDLVRRLEPLFDAVVEVQADPRPQQRWHVPDHGVTTDWIGLG